MTALTDADLRRILKDIDESDANCSAWEGQFLESVVYGSFATGKLSDKQRTAALNMVRKYRPSEMPDDY